MNALITKSTGSWYNAYLPGQGIVTARLKGTFRLKGIRNTNPVSVGDRVKLEKEKGDWVIAELEPRENYIIRRSINLSKRQHIIASNLDQSVLIITIAHPKTLSGFIDRFLVTSEAYHIPAILVFNKIDLLTEKDQQQLDFWIKSYSYAGYDCFKVSAHQPETLLPLKEKLQGKTSLFSGPSGVGKSSLLNALSPGLDLKTGSISESNDTGKHTTTFAEMFLIDNTTRFIDTPGVKSFGIVDLKREEVARYFTDLFNLSHHCKFNNCTHVNEPGCAVKQALENGELAEFRYQNYLNIFESEDDYKEEWE